MVRPRGDDFRRLFSAIGDGPSETIRHYRERESRAFPNSAQAKRFDPGENSERISVISVSLLRMACPDFRKDHKAPNGLSDTLEISSNLRPAKFGVPHSSKGSRVGRACKEITTLKRFC